MPEPTVDYYRVLQVWPDADEDAIETAYQRLRETAGDDTERLAELDEAYAVLGDADRRAEYDRERESLPAVPPAPPLPEEPSEPAPPLAATEEALIEEHEPVGAGAAPPGGGANRGLVAAMFGVVFLALAVSATVVGVALMTDDDDSRYPTGRADDEYDLEAMQLRNADLPPGIDRAEGDGFDNAEWALLLSPDNPDATFNQLEAQGRIRNHISYFTWENPVQHLGEVLSVTTQSTLYTDEERARESLRGLCGLLIDERNPIAEFSVPALGDESTGFQVREANETFGTTLDTVICFRTGRLVHAVSQQGLQGTSDLALSVRLAERMLRRVDDSFAGRSAPLDGAPTQEGG